MNWNEIEGNWKKFKGEAKRQWGKLTDDELDQVEGSRDKLSGMIQQKYGKTQAEAERELDDWAQRH